MYGAVTRNDEETRWPEFDRAFYEVKDVTGRSAEPVESAVSMVSCFGDNAAAEENPDLVPVTPEGQPATRERTHFDWAYVCPTHEEYRAGLLEIIEDCAAVPPDVRLDDVGFPRPEYCYCERCNERFVDWVERRHAAGEGPPPADTGPEDRYAWRASAGGPGRGTTARMLTRRRCGRRWPPGRWCRSRYSGRPPRAPRTASRRVRSRW